MFSGNDPYCGIDLDDCLNAQGKLKDWAKPIVNRIKGVGYGERSPSGNGIKFWTRATLPPEAKHKAYIVEGADAIEAYDRLRYFTVTGRGKGDIGDGQAVIDWLCAEYLSPQPTEQTPQLPRSVPTSGNLNAGEVIAQIKASPQSAKFNALMAGDTTGYGSQSEADLGLCGVIAFWSQETAVIDTIFRQSALMRAKWDERHRGDGATYGQMTIEEALSGNRETHTPTRRKPLSKSKRSATLREKTMIEQIKQLDLSTRESRDEAMRLIGTRRMADAINQFHASIESEANTETLENQIEGLETLSEFQSERPRPSIVQWEDIPDIERREWLIDQWLPANTVTMFTGQGGAGKSWLTLQAVCQVCCGFQDAYLDPRF